MTQMQAKARPDTGENSDADAQICKTEPEFNHPLDRAIRLKSVPGGRGFLGHTSEDYWNLIGPFGGITTGVVLNALLLQTDRLGDPLSLTVNFAGPIREGSFDVEPRLLRTSRTTQHWAVEVSQGNERNCVINAIAVFATRRPTWGDTEAVRPAAPDPESIPRFPSVSGVRWPNSYDMRFVQGGFAKDSTGNGLKDSLSSVWISDSPPRNLDFPALASICDAFFPRIYSRRSHPPPIGTISLNIHFHVSAQELSANGPQPILGVAQSQVFHNGFFDQVAQIWGKGGALLATTQQIVWFKD